MAIDLDWLEAADILFIRDERRFAGWPDAFEPHDISYLQYPDTTANGHHRRISQNDARDRLLEAMQASIEGGVLTVEMRTRQRPKGPFVPPPVSRIASGEWSGRDGGIDPMDVQRLARAKYDALPDVVTEEYKVVTRSALATWAILPAKRRSEHIQNWLESEPMQCPPQEGRVATPDTDGLVAWQAVLLESWQEITNAYGENTTARNAMLWLKKYGPRDVFPVEQPDHDGLHWIDRDGNPQSVRYKTISNQISAWKTAGKIPA